MRRWLVLIGFFQVLPLTADTLLRYRLNENIDEAYRLYLGRRAEPEGKAFWLGEIEQGKMTAGQAILLIAQSEEAKLRIVPPVLPRTTTPSPSTPLEVPAWTALHRGESFLEAFYRKTEHGLREGIKILHVVEVLSEMESHVLSARLSKNLGRVGRTTKNVVKKLGPLAPFSTTFDLAHEILRDGHASLNRKVAKRNLDEAVSVLATSLRIGKRTLLIGGVARDPEEIILFYQSLARSLDEAAPPLRKKAMDVMKASLIPFLENDFAEEEELATSLIAQLTVEVQTFNRSIEPEIRKSAELSARQVLRDSLSQAKCVVVFACRAGAEAQAFESDRNQMPKFRAIEVPVNLSLLHEDPQDTFRLLHAHSLDEERGRRACFNLAGDTSLEELRRWLGRQVGKKSLPADTAGLQAMLADCDMARTFVPTNPTKARWEAAPGAKTFSVPAESVMLVSSFYRVGPWDFNFLADPNQREQRRRQLSPSLNPHQYPPTWRNDPIRPSMGPRSR